MGWFNDNKQQWKDTKVPAPDGSWVKTRDAYKAAEKRAQRGMTKDRGRVKKK